MSILFTSLASFGLGESFIANKSERFPAIYKKKIIIFTSKGGGGHISVTQALEEYIGQQYDLKPSYIFSEVLGDIDPSTSLFGRKGEDFYNYCMQKKWFSILNSFYTMGSWYYWFKRKDVNERIISFLHTEKPHMIISVVPILNGHIMDAAREMNIPFLVVPTDLDMRTFARGIKDNSYEKFHFMIPFNEARSIETLESSGYVNPEQTSIGGFPIKKTFFAIKNKQKIKQNFGIAENRPVILLLMGAMGTDNIVRFSRLLSHLKNKAHIVVCIGKNEKVRAIVKEIKMPNHIGMTIVGFTNRIADLMSISDILITKSGSVSFCEGLYMNIPMILDGTSTILKWEKLNHQIVSTHHFGISLKKGKNIIPIVDDLLSHPEKLAQMKENLRAFTKKDGGQEALHIIKQMLL